MAEGRLAVAVTVTEGRLVAEGSDRLVAVTVTEGRLVAVTEQVGGRGAGLWQ